MIEKLKEARLASGFSQQELADKLGIKRAMLGHYETGRSPIPLLLAHQWLLACDWVLTIRPKQPEKQEEVEQALATLDADEMDLILNLIKKMT